MKSTLLKIAAILVVVFAIHACKDDDDDQPTPTPPTADQTLFSAITATGYTYYQGGAILPPVSPSPHGSFKLRFNATAQAALDSTGELPTGNSFPTGSILVKEVYTGGVLDLYAIMRKDPANVNAGSGWVWAEYNTNGAVIFSVTNKGNGCVSCHNSAVNRDLVKTFDLH